MSYALTESQFDALAALLTPGARPIQADPAAVRELERLGWLSDGKVTPAGRDAMEPYRVRRAVLLAAGFGRRLCPVTINTPKPLIRVHGKRIVDTLLDACLAAGIEEIYLVRGYLSQQFDQLRQAYPAIRFIDNPAFDRTNNISSALCASHLLSNAYVLEADLVLAQPGLIRPYEYRSNFLAFPVERSDDWCFTVRDGIITEEKLGGEHCWQMVGISYWDGRDGEQLATDLLSVFEGPDGPERYWEQVPLVFRKEHYQVAVRPCREGDVTEIDTFEELKAFDPNYDIG